MSARSFLFKTLSEEIAGVERWYSSGGIQEGQQIAPPFGIIRFSGDADENLYNHPIPRVEIWIHDRQGSYVNIDRIIDDVRRTLTFKSDWREEGGDTVVAEVRWKSSSPDLIDDGFKTATRMCSFEVIGSNL